MPEVCAKTEVLVVQNGTDEPLDIYLMQGAQDKTQVLLGTATAGTSEYRLPPRGGEPRWFQARVPPSTPTQERRYDRRRVKNLVFNVECR